MEPSPVSEEETLQSLPPEEGVIFRNSSTTLQIPSDLPLPRRAMFAALLAILAAFAGLNVGLDYLDGDSGMYTHRQLIFAQTEGAPDESSILTGVLLDSDGKPLANYSLEGHLALRRNANAVTDGNGKFQMEMLDPGQMTLDIQSPEGDMLTNLVLLNAPAGFEPIGFTHLVIQWPSDSEYANGTELSNGMMWIDYSDQQRENSTQLYDQNAAAMYDMFGTGFLGLSVITMFLIITGIRTKNSGLIRIGAITAFFSMGHFYVSCCFGILAFLLTVSLIRQD